MPLTIAVGSPFAGKGWWISREIERREGAGELGLVHLSYSGIYASLIPGTDSVFRDGRISDTGAARYAAFLLAVAIREANTRELSGYVAVDSPRRAVQAVQDIGGAPVVEVTVSRTEALRRADRHVELIRDLAPRAAQDDGAEAAQRCRQMVASYYAERPVLDGLDVRQVTAPEVPSDQAIRYAWTAAIRAAKRGDEERKTKWTRAAKAMLKRRGIDA